MEEQEERLGTIDAKTALGRYTHAIVGNTKPIPTVYELYDSEDTARRICADLNARYGEGTYSAVRIEI